MQDIGLFVHPSAGLCTNPDRPPRQFWQTRHLQNGGRSEEPFSPKNKQKIPKSPIWGLYKPATYLLWSSARPVPALHSHKAPSQAQRWPEKRAHLQMDSRCRSWRKGCRSSLHLTNLESSPHYQHCIDKWNHIISGPLAFLEQSSNKRSKTIRKTKQCRAKSPWTVLGFALKTNGNILSYGHADISLHKALTLASLILQDQVSLHIAEKKTTRPNNMTRHKKATEKLSKSQTNHCWKRMTKYPDWPQGGAT